MPKYTEDDLQAAVSAVDDGNSIRRAASLFPLYVPGSNQGNVPKESTKLSPFRNSAPVRKTT
jgi:hypothetical protein